MKVNELRIGNYVRLREHDAIVQIEQYQLCELELINLQPITLTEQWLLKSGFQRVQVKDVICYKTNQLELYQYSSNNFKIFFEYADGEVRLEYMHQLQNLHFALTGMDLIIRNKP